MVIVARPVVREMDMPDVVSHLVAENIVGMPADVGVSDIEVQLQSGDCRQYRFQGTGAIKRCPEILQDHGEPMAGGYLNYGLQGLDIQIDQIGFHGRRTKITGMNIHDVGAQSGKYPGAALQFAQTGVSNALMRIGIRQAGIGVSGDGRAGSV